MRRIILIIFASIMFANIGSADYITLEKHEFNVRDRSDRFETICVDGYKFLLTKVEKREGYGVSIAQFFEERDGKSLPAKC